MVSPKTKFLEWDPTASNNTDVGGIGILGTNAVNNFDDALRTIMAQLRSGIDGEVAYASKSGNYSSTADDNNAFHRFTATATVTLVAAATLGAGWHYAVSAVGASTVVTIDPNGSETIGGATTLIIRGGQTALIICDGTNFQVEIRGTAYATQSGGYTALVGDRNTVQRFTAAATLALTAASTLGASWTMHVVANGGAVTIDPNSSETVNGLTTLTVPDGSSCTIICDGSNFFTVFKPVFWEPIGTGLYTGSGAASFALTDLSAYKRLKITGTIFPSVATGLVVNTSSNNGSSYDAGASDYTNITLAYQASATSVTTSNATGITLSAGANVNATSAEAAQVNILIDRFNEAAYMKFQSSINADNASGIFGAHNMSRRNQATARNAVRIAPGSGTLTYSLLVEGSRI